MTPVDTLLQVTENLVVVFDLDDTLYKEIHFVRSGFRAVADALQESTGLDLYSELLTLHGSTTDDTFDTILDRHGLSSPTAQELVQVYREHEPTLQLPASSGSILARIAEHDVPLGLLTDGRSTTQRNKLRALGIEHHFAEIVVSEEIG
jgi:putative hydrolase of the HAD superfamily